MAFGVSTTTTQQNNHYCVPQAGNDGISSVGWSSQSNLLASTNWDGHIRLWEVRSQTNLGGAQIQADPKAQVNHENNSPVLCSTFSADGMTIFSGGADKAVRMWNLGSGQSNIVPQQIGSHDAPVSCVGFLPNSNLIVSGSWDNKLKFWDARSPNPVGEFNINSKVVDLDVSGSMMVAATIDKKVYVYDVSGQQPRQHGVKETQLSHQTRCIAAFPDNKGYAVGSIEGRVRIEYVQKVAGKDGFAYKCHRKQNDVYAVNSISFNKKYNTFVTCGSDGIIHFWDKDNKSRLHSLQEYPESISCSAFNEDSSLLAYGVSYDWSKGASHYNPATAKNEIYVAAVKEEFIRPKNNSSSSTSRRR